MQELIVEKNKDRAFFESKLERLEQRLKIIYKSTLRTHARVVDIEKTLPGEQKNQKRKKKKAYSPPELQILGERYTIAPSKSQSDASCSGI